MLADHDPKKWEDYPAQTAAKHRMLARYMKAWSPILGGRARMLGLPANLVIVDAFAGQGRYATGHPGSPLILRDVAGQVIRGGRVDQVELFYIEKNVENHARLVGELQAAPSYGGLIDHEPICDTFEGGAPEIIRNLENSERPSFWFIDPFGYSGLPLRLIERILSLPISEVLITLMARDIKRFLEEPNHQKAEAELFGLGQEDLLAAVNRVKQSNDRFTAVRDLYVERLEGGTRTRPRLVTSVGLAGRSPADIIYYLVHATGHPKGKREMKEAIFEETGGFNAFLGQSHASANSAQMSLFDGAVSIVNPNEIKPLLLERFSGRRLEFDVIQNDLVSGHEFDAYIDKHIKTALEELATAGRIKRFRNGRPSTRALTKGDEIAFPSS